MSIQEKFEKAVNVIRNLPKNGSYQPSHELQLRFYAYYKQATEGPNYHSKPSFWEVVKRAKWDAWAKLGNMTKDEAMMHYVEELRKIVETMSYTDNVANFLNSLDNFYENVPAEDLELLVGPIIEKIRSRPNSPLSGSPLASRDTSPNRKTVISRDTSPMRLTANNVVLNNSSKHITSSLETSPTSSYSASPLPPDTDDEDEDHFLDTQTEPDKSKEGGNIKKHRGANSQNEDQVWESSIKQEKSTALHSGLQGPSIAINGDINPQEQEPVQNFMSIIRNDMEQIKSRLHCFEKTVANQACNAIPRSDQDHKSISPGTFTATSEAFKSAIENMTREVEMLQRRMAILETRRQQELSIGRKRGGNVLTRWWGLPLQTTAFFLAWPIIVIFISRWLSNRQRH